MEDRQEFKKTEQFAIEEEERENQWQKEYGEKLPLKLEQMDRLLKEGTEEAKWKLQAMFLDKSFFNKYKQTDEMAMMYVVMLIFEKERNSGITSGILDAGRDIAQLRDYIQSMKFLLYRLDFDIEEEAGEKLIQYFKEQNTSTVVIEMMMTTVVMRPLIVAQKLEKLFEQHYMLKELLMIYNFINKERPGNYRILWEQAKLYEKIGYHELAQECWSQIPDYPKEVCGEPENVFLIQEKLWELQHIHKTAYIQVAEEVKKSRILPEGWRYFLQNEPVFKPECYLLLANAMLNEELTLIAKETLVFADKEIPGNELILTLLADLCVNQGTFQEALGYLEQIEAPSDMVLKLMQMCRERIRG